MSSARSSVMTSKAAMCRRSWAGVVMPAWWSPWNGTMSPGAASGGGRRDGVVAEEARGQAGDRAGAADPGEGEEAAAGQAAPGPELPAARVGQRRRCRHRA